MTPHTCPARGRLVGGALWLAAGLAVAALAGAGVEVTDRPADPDGPPDPPSELVVVGGGELHYSRPVTRRQAGRAAEALAGCGFFDGRPRVAQLRRVCGTYQLRARVPPGGERDERAADAARHAAAALSDEALGGSPVEVHLCDVLMQTVRVVRP